MDCHAQSTNVLWQNANHDRQMHYDNNNKNLVFQSFVVVPTSLSSKGKLPKGGQHIIEISKKLEAPIQ